MSRRRRAPSPKVRLFIPDALAPAAEITVGASQAHYLRRVMRLATGEGIRLFNGRDGEWLGHVDGTGRAVRVIVERRLRSQEAEDGPWLAFAPVKKSATDYIVEKATELGVSRLLPVLTERTVAERVNVERLRAVAIEAAEQCGRLTVPDLAEPTALPDFVSGWPARRPLLVAHPQADGAALPLLDALAALPTGAERPDATPAPAGLVIGPEGGFSAAEVDGLLRLPCAKVCSLGPRTLRTETAAAAVLAVWQAVAAKRRGPAPTP